MEEEITRLLESNNYDIRISGDARWLDQKCTMDVISIVADCILEYLGEDKEKKFKVKDIWFNQYTIDNVQSIFRKPNPQKKAKNEYDKWFSQPMKLFGYTKILIETKEGRENVYQLSNENVLRYIAQRENNAHKFLCYYIEKVLEDSNLKEDFEEFFSKQDKNAYKKLKETFAEFTIDNTEVNGKLECNRIFTKVVNPLAFEKNKKGTKGGRLSKHIITRDMLMYNRPNWRDNRKPKNMTRAEFEVEMKQKLAVLSEYRIQKAKNQLRSYNEVYRDGQSEIKENNNYQKGAINMHHIFPKSDFKSISDYVENLIALTPNQHYILAHPNGNTQYIDRNFQHVCLINKVNSIKENLLKEDTNKIYSFQCMIKVLNIGLNTNEFDEVQDMDFDRVIEIINAKY